MKRSIVVAATLLCLTTAAMAHEPAKARIEKDAKVFSKPEDLMWAPFVLPGSQQAALWGNPEKGEHGVLYRWPAGSAAPLHHHSNGDHGVVIAGTLAIQPEGGAVQELTPGSYFSMGGGVKHTTTCKAGADCLFFVHREGSFDAVMADEAAKKTK